MLIIVQLYDCTKNFNCIFELGELNGVSIKLLFKKKKTPFISHC